MTDIFLFNGSKTQQEIAEEFGYTVISDEIVPQLEDGSDVLDAPRVATNRITKSDNDNGESYVQEFLRQDLDKIEELTQKSRITLEQSNKGVSEIEKRRDGRDPESIPTWWTDKIAAEMTGMMSMFNTAIQGATISSTRAGSWSDSGMWDAGRIPTDNDIVYINHTCTYDVNSTAKIKDIYVSMAGSFRRSDNDLLWVDTIWCMGEYWQGDFKNPISSETVFQWTQNPMAMARLGLMTMGKVRIYGQPKTSRVECDSTISAGSTSATLPMTGANWAVGDKIIFCATEWRGNTSIDADYAGPNTFYLGSTQRNDQGFTQRIQVSGDEVRTITAISGDTVTWDTALSYDHVLYEREIFGTPNDFVNKAAYDVYAAANTGTTYTIKPVVANLTRSIVYRSAKASEGANYDLTDFRKRGHTMFMHSDDVQCAYAEARDLGRTKIDPTLTAPDGFLLYEDAAETILLTDPENVTGRYPWHLHRNGAFLARKLCIFESLTSYSSEENIPIEGWGITHHSARAAIDNCVVHNVRGAGIVSEVGDEQGQWIGNVVSYCRGDNFNHDWGKRSENVQNHNGHAGIGYECQARQVLQQDNLASSCYIGWSYLQQDKVTIPDRIADQYSLRYFDPIASGDVDGLGGDDRKTYGIEQAQIPDFTRNRCGNCSIGFFVAHRQFTDRTDNTPALFKQFHCTGTKQPLNISNYTFNYSFYDSVWIGRDAANSFATNIGTVSWAINFVRMHFENFDRGVRMGIGYDSYIIDNQFVNVNQGLPDDVTLTRSSPDTAEEYPAINVMYTADQIDNSGTGFTCRTRVHQNLDSSSDLPQNFPNTPYGVAGSNPNSGQAVPNFWLDTANSDLIWSDQDAYSQILIAGIVRDEVGSRRFGDNQNQESFAGNYIVVDGRRAEGLTGVEFVKRNGCYEDNGTWYSRLCFMEHERLSGDYFFFPVVVELQNFDAQLLADNTIVPAAMAMEPLKPELVRFKL